MRTADRSDPVGFVSIRVPRWPRDASAALRVLQLYRGASGTSLDKLPRRPAAAVSIRQAPAMVDPGDLRQTRCTELTLMPRTPAIAGLSSVSCRPMGRPSIATADQGANVRTASNKVGPECRV